MEKRPNPLLTWIEIFPLLGANFYNYNWLQEDFWPVKNEWKKWSFFAEKEKKEILRMPIFLLGIQ